MQIIKCGTQATVPGQNIDGIITCCSMRFNEIRYELSYFLNGELKEVWLNESQFTIKNKSVVKIGFK